MTFEQKMKELLEESGMFPEDASEVITLAKTTEMLKSMRKRWSDDTDGYPPMIVHITWLSVKQVALEYIDKNTPEAWYRPVFVE